METKPFIAKEEQEKLTCCAECTSNFESEALHLKPLQSSKQIPSWLQQFNINQSHSKEFVELRRKWNRFCSSLHRDGSVQGLMGKNFSYSSSYPWWPKFNESNSISFTDYQTTKPLQSSNLVPRFRRQQSCTTIEFDFGNATTKQEQGREPSLNSLKHMAGCKEVKITLALGNDPLLCDSSAESTELESEMVSLRRGEILKALRENVPWQAESIDRIAEAVAAEKSLQWILFEGNDFVAKRKLALAIAESALGSVDLLFELSTKTEDIEILESALKTNRKLVVLVEDVDFADSQFMKFLANGFENGKFGEIREESLEKIIFILTKDYASNKKNNNRGVIEMALKIEPRANANADHHKRKAEQEQISNKSKTQKSSTSDFDNKNRKSSIINTLDLNIKAEEQEEEKLPEGGEISPISSDVTTICDPKRREATFLDWIETKLILDRKTGQKAEMKAELMRMITAGYEEVNCTEGECRFRVEEGVVEGIVEGYGRFTKGLFERWVKEIFQRRLGGRGRYGGKGVGNGIDIRLCLDHHQRGVGFGYMGSCLPNKISFSSCFLEDLQAVFM